MSKALQLDVRWVPGTLNRLLLHTPQGSFQVPLERFERVLGAQASHPLYLTGKTHLELPEHTLQQLVA